MIVTVLGFVPVAVIALLLFRPDSESWIVPAVAGVVILSVLEYIPVFKLLVAQRRETAAGYTSLRWPKDATLAQVDPATGTVVREGGTPRLSGAQYRVARARAQNPLAF